MKRLVLDLCVIPLALSIMLTACGDDDTPASDAGPRTDSGGATDAGSGADGSIAEDGGTSVFPALGEPMRETPGDATGRGCCRNEVGIGLNGAGEPRMVGMRDTPKDLWFSALGDGMWVDEEASTTPFAERTAFAIGSDDVPHVLVHSGDGLLYVRKDSDVWSEVVVDMASEVSSRATHFDVALDSANTPHVAYLDSNTRTLKYGVWNGASFDLSDVDVPVGSGDQNGEYATLAVATDGTVHFAYLATVSEAKVLRHASGTPGSWTVEDVPGMGKGVYGAIMVASTGDVHIVSTDLRVSRARGVYWSVFDGSWTETEIEADMAIVALDAVLDSGDRPHIMTSESIALGLGPWRYYRWNGDAFEPFRRPMGTTSEGPFPESVSIAVDSSLMPHMAVPGGYVHY